MKDCTRIDSVYGVDFSGAKLAGRKVMQLEGEGPQPAAVDLMAALRASVERARAARGAPATKQAPPRKKTAARKRTARPPR